MASDRAYVWIWLPNHQEPIPCGALRPVGNYLEFAYGKAYLDNPEAISIFPEELPLQPGWFSPASNMALPSAIKDAAPDAWGMRIIENQMGFSATTAAGLPEIEYLMRSSSNRIGALDFQWSATEYVPRLENDASLEDLAEAAHLLET